MMKLFLVKGYAKKRDSRRQYWVEMYVFAEHGGRALLLAMDETFPFGRVETAGEEDGGWTIQELDIEHEFVGIKHWGEV